MLRDYDNHMHVIVFFINTLQICGGDHRSPCFRIRRIKQNPSHSSLTQILQSLPSFTCRTPHQHYSFLPWKLGSYIAGVIMAGGKASNISDLIQKVASSCIITPLPCRNAGEASDDDLADQEDDGRAYSIYYGSVNGRSTRLAEEEEKEEEEERFRLWEEEEKRDGEAERAKAAEGMMAEVFEAVSAVKRAYVKLQEAHCPWDPERMRAADAAVVAELRRLGRLKERWWFRRGGGKGVGRAAVAVEPYEAAVEELKRELRAKEAEVEGLKERLRRGSDDGDGGGGRRRSSGHRAARRRGSQGK